MINSIKVAAEINKLKRIGLLLTVIAIVATLFINLLIIDPFSPKTIPSKLAGKNSKELKKVISWYSRESKDSLKLRAAHFLIDNMVYQYGISQCLSDRDGNELTFDYSLFSPLEFKKLIRVMDSLQYRYKKETPVYDIQIIKADYLIENIDDAFTAWQYPWAQHLSFEDFCEHVLPYRSQTEPLSSYRKYFMDQFQWLPDSLPETYELIDLINIVKRHLEKKVVYSEEIPLFYHGYLTPSELEKVKVAACENLALYFQLALRSLGVPARCDKVLAWRHRNSQHLYNSVADFNGTEYYFGLHGKYRGLIDPHLNRTRTWRLTFSIATPPAELAEANGLHPQFINPYYHDITPLYAPVRQLGLTLDRNLAGEYIYLCVFNFGEWRPIAYTAAESDGKVSFPAVVPETIYRLCSFDNNAMVSLTIPFRLDSLSNVTMLHPDLHNTQSIVIERSPDQNWIRLNSDANNFWFTLQYMSEEEWVPLRSDSFTAFSFDADSAKVWHKPGKIPTDRPVRYEISFKSLPKNALFYWGGFSKPFSVADNKIIF